MVQRFQTRLPVWLFESERFPEVSAIPQLALSRHSPEKVEKCILYGHVSNLSESTRTSFLAAILQRSLNKFSELLTRTRMVSLIFEVSRIEMNASLGSQLSVAWKVASDWKPAK